MPDEAIALEAGAPEAEAPEADALEAEAPEDEARVGENKPRLPSGATPAGIGDEMEHGGGFQASIFEKMAKENRA